jgi:flavin reductase (DIM6/NTAB) family NADH-FMN oxidoreductase RutF
MENNAFAVNILAASQKPLAIHFSGRPQEGIDLAWETGTVAPRLKDALAYLECVPRRAYNGWDHTLYLGEVVDFGWRNDDALGLFGGSFLSVPMPAHHRTPEATEQS